MFSNKLKQLLQKNNFQVTLRKMSTSSVLGESKWGTFPQGRIHYREIGSGKPIIFIHGAFMNGDLWRKVVPSLATKYKCICPDLPLGAHAESMKPDADLSIYGIADLIKSFSESLNLSEKPTFIANDSGGAITQVMITRHPEVASRVIFTNCDCFENFPPGVFRYLPYVTRVVPGMGWIMGKMFSSKTILSSRYGFGWLMNGTLPPEIIESFIGRLKYPDQRRDLVKFISGATNYYTLEAAKKLGDFKKPVFVVWGKDDRFFPVSDGKRLAASFPNAQMEIIENANCLVMEDNPKALSEAVHKFLASS